MIEVQHLTKKYGNLFAVKDLNFKVEEGKIWGLLGPNAAGKTTTIRILTGYLPATEGNAIIAGFDIFEQPNDAKRIMGYLPENVPLYPDMTVQSYLDFVADIKQIPSAQKKGAVQKTIQTSGLESVQKRLIKNISRGFKQRVGLAQALVHDPKILILDEPTISLDPAQRIEILELIKSFKGEKTIILSTHLLTDVKLICDGMMIIDKGNLKGNGYLSELTEPFKKIEVISLKVKAPAKEAAPLLKTLAGEGNVRRQDDGFIIGWSKGHDLRDEITGLIVEKDLGLIEMKTIEPSIEELYVKIISGGN